jgi:transposase
MDSIGLDLHLRECQVCVIDASGAARQQRIPTSVKGLDRVFAARPPAQVVVEASTESEWVAQHLESLGHRVRVADPNDARLYAGRSRHIKTDARDAYALAEAAKRSDWRVAHRPCAARRALRRELAGRELLVRTRSRLTTQVRAFVRGEGLRVPAATPDTFERHVRALSVPTALEPLLACLLIARAAVHTQVARCDARVAALALADPDVLRAMTVPGVGVITASAFVAALDDVHRFRSGEHVASYLGLVPRERSSSERRRLGGLTKAGDTRTRWLLVEAAWTIRRSRRDDTVALRAWCRSVEQRRGRSVAVVALARRLAVILFTMWRDTVPYDATRLRLQGGANEHAA